MWTNRLISERNKATVSNQESLSMIGTRTQHVKIMGISWIPSSARVEASNPWLEIVATSIYEKDRERREGNGFWLFAVAIGWMGSGRHEDDCYFHGETGEGKVRREAAIEEMRATGGVLLLFWWVWWSTGRKSGEGDKWRGRSAGRVCGGGDGLGKERRRRGRRRRGVGSTVGSGVVSPEGRKVQMERGREGGGRC
ncbi:hypothetical protein HAX54_020278 [Datura stramonium]|uniref:Uncharacterized protein n=1 Tax=Datura stramonium TaxID=4076 RepID=A0ABS8UST8_DATST|nr:hypothetical protein [Datura stramonium]